MSNEQQSNTIQQLTEAFKLLEQQNLPPLMIEIDLMDAWIVMSVLQLALRHPHLNESPSVHVAKGLAVGIQGMFAQLNPFLGTVAEQGWHPEFDQSDDIND